MKGIREANAETNEKKIDRYRRMAIRNLETSVTLTSLSLCERLEDYDEIIELYYRQGSSAPKIVLNVNNSLCRIDNHASLVKRGIYCIM